MDIRHAEIIHKSPMLTRYLTPLRALWQVFRGVAYMLSLEILFLEKTPYDYYCETEFTIRINQSIIITLKRYIWYMRKTIHIYLHVGRYYLSYTIQK